MLGMSVHLQFTHCSHLGVEHNCKDDHDVGEIDSVTVVCKWESWGGKI